MSGPQKRSPPSPPSSSPSTDVTSQSRMTFSERPWDVLHIMNNLPAINQASMRLAQTASSFGQGLAALLGEAVNTDVPSRGGSSSQASTSTPSSSASSDLVGASSSQNNFQLSSTPNLWIGKATSSLTDLSQRFLTTPSTLYQGFMGRIQTTWRGSAEDVGWIKRIPGVANVEDKSDRFEQILRPVCNGVHKLPDNLVYLLVPGLFSNYGPLYFTDTKEYFSKLGLTCHIAKIHSEAAVETNASVLKDYIEELYWGSGKQVAVLGHSKGGVDAAAAISMNWATLKDKVAGLVVAQSPYGGSPIASDILREGQIADAQTRYLIELLMHKMGKGDVRALDDLTYAKRKEFLSKYPLPHDIPIVSFHTEVSLAPHVFSTLSHVAHAEFPWLTSMPSSTSEPVGTKLPVIIPLPAAMAFCAKHIEFRYGHKSDGLVVREDAEVPGSVVVRPTRKLDHAWMVYSPARKDSSEPDSSHMCEALLTLLLEVRASKGLRK